METAPTLLYIDDASADVELMRTLLIPRGIKVDAARTGARGIALYDPSRHAVVAVDWNLPDMDGLEVAKKLLAMHGDCMIAFITGLMEQEDRNAAAAVGIDRCFIKNAQMEHIAAVGDLVHESVAAMAVKRAG